MARSSNIRIFRPMMPITDSYEYAPGGANSHRKRILSDVGECVASKLVIASVDRDKLTEFGRAIRQFGSMHGVDLESERYIDEMVGVLGERLGMVPYLPLNVVANDGNGRELQVGFRPALPKGSRPTDSSKDFSFNPINGIFKRGNTPRGIQVSGQLPPRQRFYPNPGVDKSIVNLNRILPVVVAGPVQVCS